MGNTGIGFPSETPRGLCPDMDAAVELMLNAVRSSDPDVAKVRGSGKNGTWRLLGIVELSLGKPWENGGLMGFNGI